MTIGRQNDRKRVKMRKPKKRSKKINHYLKPLQANFRASVPAAARLKEYYSSN